MDCRRTRVGGKCPPVLSAPVVEKERAPVLSTPVAGRWERLETRLGEVVQRQQVIRDWLSGRLLRGRTRGGASIPLVGDWAQHQEQCLARESREWHRSS